MAWQKNTDRNSLRTDIPKESLTEWRERVPREDGDYIFTNLAEYDDLTAGRKIVDEVRENSAAALRELPEFNLHDDFIANTHIPSYHCRFFRRASNVSHALAQIDLGKDSHHYLDGVLWTE
jgi:hypothetical protein